MTILMFRYWRKKFFSVTNTLAYRVNFSEPNFQEFHLKWWRKELFWHCGDELSVFKNTAYVGSFKHFSVQHAFTKGLIVLAKLQWSATGRGWWWLWWKWLLRQCTRATLGSGQRSNADFTCYSRCWLRGFNIRTLPTGEFHFPIIYPS